jgi:RNA polymerase sigma factor (sigma-70 family)
LTTQEYNQTVDNVSDSLYRFLLKSSKNKMLSEDLVQESFEKLWIHHQEIEVNKAKSWLFTTAYRMFIDWHRRESKQVDESPTEQQSPWVHPVNHDLQSILHQALESLPLQQKQVVLLRDYEGYSYDEIGEITSLSESQVKVSIFRARKALKNYIGKLDLVV